ncbi:MAG: cofactor-independent phosphoglycerate mutase, partial [Syntrophales bacterium]|nr:cofactor-independent phosphoglycerate mutase [Syntrophales bacterium]
MKYLILLGDGMADYPLKELGGKTPLEFARTPYMDRIASEGTLGLVNTIPSGFLPGSDIANLSVLGYDPRKCYTGRGPLEAASMGVQLGNDDVAFRCNLVTIGTGEAPVMEDFTSGHITSGEARQIIADLQRDLGTVEFQFYPGVSYRHLLVWRRGRESLETTPPHDITGKAINDYLPRGESAREINSLMQRSQEILFDHPVNRLRLSEGKKPAVSIWLWGQGRAPWIVPFAEKYHLTGGIISAVDLLKGIGVLAGLKVIHVEGATGYTDTNYLGKAEKALEALRELDFVFVHVEAPDEMGHEGNIEGKIRAIEDFDEKIVGAVLTGINSLYPFRVMIVSDHPTPISLMTHSSEPSPFAVLSSIAGENTGNAPAFGETSAKDTGIMVSPGYLIMDVFIKNWRKFIEEY